MGRTSDLENAQQVTSFDSPEESGLLEKFDSHLANIRHSLSVARMSLDKIQGLVNHKEDEDKPGLSNLTNVFEKHKYKKVTKLRLEVQKHQNIDADFEKRCQYNSALTTVSKDIATRVIPESRRAVSFNCNANYNTSNPDLPQQSESNVDQTLPEESGLDSTLPDESGFNPTLAEDGGLDLTIATEGGLDPILAQEGGLDPILAQEGGLDEGNEKITVHTKAPTSTTELEPENVKEDILNTDTLPAPSIMIISATPFEAEREEDEIDLEDSIIEEPPTVSTEKRVSKQVSFNETAIEEVRIIPENTSSRRISLDENTLTLAEKRKLDEETKRMSISRTHSVDLVVRSASRVLEELEQANEAEAAAKFDAFNQRSDATPVTTTERPSETKSGDKTPQDETERSSPGLDVDHDRQDREKSMVSERSDQEAGSFNEETAEQPKTVTQVLKTIDKVIYKDGVAMMWKKLEYSDDEVLVPVPPNSIFSDQQHSILSSSTAEKEKAKKHRESCDAYVKRMIGPAAYRRMFKSPKSAEDKSKIRGADWALQMRSQKFFSKPPILYWEQWKINNMKKNYLGPGSYELKDFIQLGNAKPRSEIGICDQLGPRFEKATQNATPGPGTYGIGGVPHKAIEDRANRSFSTKGMLDAGDRRRDLPLQGSDLAPGTYRQKSCLDEVLNKVTSLRGPYDLFTARRKDPIKTGFYPTPKRTPLGPGYYKYKSFVEELTTSKYNYRARFGKQTQYPEVPTERFVLFSKSGAPAIYKDFPAPNAYDVKELSKYTTVNQPGFLSSSSRNDKMSERIFSLSSSPVGPGRYATEKCDQHYVNGHTNVFKSKAEKPSLKMARFFEERLQSKHKNVETSTCHPGKTNRSVIGI